MTKLKQQLFDSIKAFSSAITIVTIVIGVTFWFSPNANAVNYLLYEQCGLDVCNDGYISVLTHASEDPNYYKFPIARIKEYTECGNPNKCKRDFVQVSSKEETIGGFVDLSFGSRGFGDFVWTMEELERMIGTNETPNHSIGRKFIFFSTEEEDINSAYTNIENRFRELPIENYNEFDANYYFDHIRILNRQDTKEIQNKQWLLTPYIPGNIRNF